MSGRPHHTVDHNIAITPAAAPSTPTSPTPKFVAAAPALEVDVVAVVLVVIIEDELGLHLTHTVVEGDIKLSVVEETAVGEARETIPEESGVGVEIPMVMMDEAEGLARVSVRRETIAEVSEGGARPVGLDGRVAIWRVDVTVVSLA